MTTKQQPFWKIASENKTSNRLHTVLGKKPKKKTLQYFLIKQETKMHFKKRFILFTSLYCMQSKQVELLQPHFKKLNSCFRSDWATFLLIWDICQSSSLPKEDRETEKMFNFFWKLIYTVPPKCPSVSSTLKYDDFNCLSFPSP